MMNCKKLDKFGAKPINDTIASWENLTDKRVVPLRYDPSQVWEISNLLNSLNDVCGKQTSIVWRVLRNELSDRLQVIGCLRSPSHFSHFAIRSLT